MSKLVNLCIYILFLMVVEVEIRLLFWLIVKIRIDIRWIRGNLGSSEDVFMLIMVNIIEVYWYIYRCKYIYRYRYMINFMVCSL